MTLANSGNYIYGIHAVQEAILSGRELERVLIGRYARGEQVRELLKLVRQSDIPCQLVPQEKLNFYTRRNHQGVVALLSPVIYRKTEHLIPQLFENGEVPLLLILDGITDVRNLGAIARTAECAGVHGLILPVRGNAQVTADAVKTSSGALNTLPVCRTGDLYATVKFLKESGLTVLGSSEKAEVLFFDADYKDPLAIVLGAEDTGISAGILKSCDALLKIPVFGSIGSLNVSVAAAILLYETVRQRKFNRQDDRYRQGLSG